MLESLILASGEKNTQYSLSNFININNNNININNNNININNNNINININ